MAKRINKIKIMHYGNSSDDLFHSGVFYARSFFKAQYLLRWGVGFFYRG